MKKAILFFSLMVVIPQFVRSQITWNQQTGVGTTDLYGVHFPNLNNGWAVGLNGIILVTTNGGNTWIQQASPVGSNLSCVFFVDANNGWACGDGGTIIHTTNGGSNWAVQSTPNLNTLRSIHFSDVNNGWCCGTANTIFHTSNGGTTWTAQTSSAPANAVLTAVQFPSSTTGYVAASINTPNGYVMNTTNSGTAWANQSAPTTNNLNALDFMSTTTGWATGKAGTIYKTVNSGATWSNSNTGVGTHIYRGVSFATLNDGWVVGDSGYIYHTANGGTSWTWQNTFMISTLRSVHFVDATDGWAVGDNGTILRIASPGGVHESGLLSVINIYPNPTTGNSTIEISSADESKAKYSVTDLSGRIILEENIQLQQGENTIPVQLPADLDKGIYTVIIETESGERAVNRLSVE
ncbi:MAG TPA: YCF48-related protein [Bacteroidia bacterium]|jgi:photosystem II stability/assembly factor-like uncharacterized protein|nr:YCF48-related protein [Bacteroidia bacterium]